MSARCAFKWPTDWSLHPHTPVINLLTALGIGSYQVKSIHNANTSPSHTQNSKQQLIVSRAEEKKQKTLM